MYESPEWQVGERMFPLRFIPFLSPSLADPRVISTPAPHASTNDRFASLWPIPRVVQGGGGDG